MRAVQTIRSEHGSMPAKLQRLSVHHEFQPMGGVAPTPLSYPAADASRQPRMRGKSCPMDAVFATRCENGPEACGRAARGGLQASSTDKAARCRGAAFCLTEPCDWCISGRKI